MTTTVSTLRWRGLYRMRDGFWAAVIGALLATAIEFVVVLRCHAGDLSIGEHNAGQSSAVPTAVAVGKRNGTLPIPIGALRLQGQVVDEQERLLQGRRWC